MTCFSFFSTLIFSFILFLHSQLYSWNSSGHKIAAEIAYENLNPETKVKVDEILQTLGQFYPNNNTFASAATWADDIKIVEGFHLFDTWHYTNIPYDPQKLLSPEQLELIAARNQGKDVVWAISQAIRTLSSPTSSPFSRALMLNFLIHTVADSHQPLHSCSRYSKAHPQGDRGGNLFPIQLSPQHFKKFDLKIHCPRCNFNLKTAVGLRKEMQDFELESLPRGGDHSQKVKAPPLGRDSSSKGCVYLPDPTAVFRFKQDKKSKKFSTNLHLFWDSGAGAFLIAEEKIKDFAHSLVQQYPEKEFPHAAILDPVSWNLESRSLAESVAYQIQENTIPSDEYIALSQKTSSQRITLAGYRLAKLLNQIFSSTEK